MKIELLLGSIRKGRQTYWVARHLLAVMQAQADWEVGLIDLAEHPLPMLTERWAKSDAPAPVLVEVSRRLQAADGIIFISPEYHGSYTGALKNAIDHYWQEFKRKPIGVVATGAGRFGGINGSIEMQQLILSLGAFPMPHKLLVPFVQRTYDETGQAVDERIQPEVEKFVGEYHWFAQAITQARQAALPPALTPSR